MTEPTLSTVQQPTPEAAPQRERSSIGFPYNDLSDGIQVAHAVHALGDRCGHEQLIVPLGYTTVDNGAYNLRCAGARHFGLISYSKEGVTLSSLGHRVVDATQEERARADAFLSVPLYKRLYEEYKGRSLPPTNLGLEAVLVSYGVAAKQKDKARQVLQRSADQSGFFFQGRDRLVMPAIVNQVAPRDGAGAGGSVNGTGADGDGKNNGNHGGNDGGGDYPTLIRGMLEKLPREGASWSKTDRDQWVTAFQLVLDIAYKVEAAPPLMIAAPVSNGVSAEA